MSSGYVHTLPGLEKILDRFIEQSMDPVTSLSAIRSMVAINGEVGLVIAERLEAIVNVLEDMEKTL